MSRNQFSPNYQVALRDFQKARQQAAVQQLMARLRGESNDLLCYDTVRQQLKATGPPIQKGLQEIPLDKIIGSVGRFEDFTRGFLPKKDGNQERWVGVKTAVQDMTGMPPIEVYQVGDGYFVQDGNHRVSIARQLGTPTISAYVTEVKTRVPLTAVDDASEIICKSFYADFLELTNLDKLFPDADLLMTFCDEYDLFVEQINVEKNLLIDGNGHKDDQELWEKSVSIWYEQVYMPIIDIIREVGILRRFPSRTEADMYFVLSERHDDLEKGLGWHVEMETAVTELVEDAKPNNIFQRVIQTIFPFLDQGPEPGLWRKQQLARRRNNRLFEHILIDINGRPEGWHLLDQMLVFSQYDKDHILGLHVVPSKAEYDQDSIAEIQKIFNEKCEAAEIEGELAIEISANPMEPIIERAAWSDFVVVNTRRPVEGQPRLKLSPRMRQLVQHCSRPMLVVPAGSEITMRRPILGYEGSRGFLWL